MVPVAVPETVEVKVVEKGAVRAAVLSILRVVLRVGAATIFTVAVPTAVAPTAFRTVIWNVLLPRVEQDTTRELLRLVESNAPPLTMVQPAGGIIEEAVTTLVALVDVQETVKFVLMVAVAGAVTVTVGSAGFDITKVCLASAAGAVPRSTTTLG